MKKVGVILTCSAVLLVLAMPICQAAQKKLIQLGYFDPDPDFFVSDMNDPYNSPLLTPLDGTSFRVTPSGGTRNDFLAQFWGTRAFTWAEMQGEAAKLAGVNFDRFTENFLKIDCRPANVDWFSDFSAIVNNWGIAQRIVKEGGVRGILWDPENYEGNLWHYPSQALAGSKTFAQYQAQVRLRGQQVMDQLLNVGPGDANEVVVFILLAYGRTWDMYINNGGDPGDPTPDLSNLEYGLFPSFLDGLLDHATSAVRLIDGYESYLHKTRAAFEQLRTTFTTGCLPIVADDVKYAATFKLGLPVWIDYGWRTGEWYEAPEELHLNYYDPGEWQKAVRFALETSDEYVWLYCEHLAWWDVDWAPGPEKNIPQAYLDATAIAWTADCSEAIARGYGRGTDFDMDCYTRVGDVSALAAEWLNCNNPGDPGCVQSWPDPPQPEPVPLVPLQFVTIGDAGNADDPEETWWDWGPPAPAPGTGFHFGGVSYVYEISKYETTNAQYAEFLNAVAASDPHSLWVSQMADPTYPNRGGIIRSGSDGSYTYSLISGRENQPVGFITWYAAARFCNWLHNGKQNNPATTESGAYTNIDSDPLTHESGALYWIPTGDEWYKAAFYKGTGTQYWDFAIQESYPENNGPQAGPNGEANYMGDNYNWGEGLDRADKSEVGYYNEPSHYGTYDQCGNLVEWAEEWNPEYTPRRLTWDGWYTLNAWNYVAPPFYQLNKANMGALPANYLINRQGFRVAKKYVP